MNKALGAFLAATLVLVAACASAPPAAPPAPKGPDLTGTWTVTTESQMGAQDSALTVKQTGNAIAGTMATQMGTFPYTGTVNGNAVNFNFMFNAQGQELKIDYNGTIDGDTMKGKAVFGTFGEGSFTAKKKS